MHLRTLRIAAADPRRIDVGRRLVPDTRDGGEPREPQRLNQRWPPHALPSPSAAPTLRRTGQAARPFTSNKAHGQHMVEALSFSARVGPSASDCAGFSQVAFHAKVAAVAAAYGVLINELVGRTHLT